MVNNNNTTTFSLRSVLEKEKLNGTNFLDWFRNLRIVLKQERKDYVLENAIPEEPGTGATRAEKDAYQKHVNDDLDVSCLMLASMNSDLQKQFENMNTFDMVNELKNLFQKQARVERYETTKSLFSCKLPEGASVSPHVLKMIGYIDHLQRLGTTMSQELATDVILQSLPESYDGFTMNFNMHGMDKTLTELHGMLKTAEQNIVKKGKNHVLMVHKGKGFKKSGNSKGKSYANGKGKAPVKNWNNKVANSEPKPNPQDEMTCFYCDGKGHWKRNCKKYLDDKKKGIVPTNKGIYVTKVKVTQTSFTS